MSEYREPYVDDSGHIIRQDPLQRASIYRKDIGRLDVRDLEMYDWIEGIGEINDFGILGFFRQMTRAGFKLRIDQW